MTANLVICVGRDVNKQFSCLISDVTPDLGLLGEYQIIGVTAWQQEQTA